MSIYTFGPFQLDDSKRTLARDGKLIGLTPKAFSLLLLLVENNGKVLDKDYLLRKIWKENIVEEGNLSVNIYTLRKALGDTLQEHKYIITHPNRGYGFVGEVRKSELQPVREVIEPAGGALRLFSPYYIERMADLDLYASIDREDMIVLINGPRQVGKTSLMARGLQRARDAGKRVIPMDFQQLNASKLGSIESLTKAFIEMIAEELGMELDMGKFWKASFGPSTNLERFLRRDVLTGSDVHYIWAMDEADRIFGLDYSSELFGLFRSWHNKRALEPDGPWSHLTLLIAYASEAHLFITDLNQSPFNVGTRIHLEDFTEGEAADLNRRYGSPLMTKQELELVLGEIGGHPYLLNLVLREIKTNGGGLDRLFSEAGLDSGPLSDHLLRMLLSLVKEPSLVAFVGDLLAGRPVSDVASFYRLRSAGIVRGNTVREAEFRCHLYKTYLGGRLG